MSLEYDHYIFEHRSYVKKALEWMQENIPNKLVGDVIADTLLHIDIHDESKFDRDEYDAYDKFFYGGNRSYQVVQDFNTAWLKHIHKNPHHWQYWVLINDDPSEGIKALDMPLDYIYEMIADWWSFSWRDNNLTEIFEWYMYHKDYMRLSVRTRLIVEDILQAIGEVLAKQMIMEGAEPYNFVMHSDEDDEDKHYGLPKLKKFPLPDRKHVISAIKFFNYADPKDEETLANAILKRIEELGMNLEDIGVGDGNRFKKYMPKNDKEEN